MTVMLEIQGLTKEYKAVVDTDTVCVLRDINLMVSTGEAVAVMGPSGSGKSTLLNLIAALDRPTSGHIKVDGRDIGELSDQQLTLMRNQQIGLIFQTHHLLPQCTAIENVLIPTLPMRGVKREVALARAIGLLERVGLKDRVHHLPSQLSTGQCQRVAAARALINEPKLLLADEPTGALDRRAGDAMADLLLALNDERQVTLLIATHDAALARRCGRVVELGDGKLVERGAIV